MRGPVVRWDRRDTWLRDSGAAQSGSGRVAVGAISVLNSAAVIVTVPTEVSNTTVVGFALNSAGSGVKLV